MTKPNALDLLVTRVTAFADWNDMVGSMKAGYCPTLNGSGAYAKLCGIVRRNGFKAFRKGLVL